MQLLALQAGTITKYENAMLPVGDVLQVLSKNGPVIAIK
jgi:hypothetical protein